MSDTLTIRRATPDDAPAIARHRRLMFEAMGFTDPARLDVVEAAAVPWIADRITREEYLGWLAVTGDGFAASGAGLWVREFPPGPRDLCGRRGYSSTCTPTLNSAAGDWPARSYTGHCTGAGTVGSMQ